jgi:hypothetical protein
MFFRGMSPSATSHAKSARFTIVSRSSSGAVDSGQGFPNLLVLQVRESRKLSAFSATSAESRRSNLGSSLVFNEI